MNTNRRKPSAALTRILSSITEEEKRRTRDRMLVAVRIADALEAKQLSQKAFAGLMGKSESEISEWLSGNRNFTVDTLSDISECLGIHLLPVTDFQIKRVSTLDSCRRVTKTRSPRRYELSGDSIFKAVTNEWSTTPNSAFMLA